ncbi:hypothetical protein GCM10023149_11830 [Mucilaginibacter gynuensis]|uniref:MFS transporter n=1 Tax=Mucilaginibacter gynuensis TaxID=1302236 RepID=A0ABP8G1B9_9SPHI
MGTEDRPGSSSATSALPGTAAAQPIYNLQFALLCLSSLLFSASYNMLIPELPGYLSGLGGAEYKGLIIALFTLTAGISRRSVVNLPIH